MTAPFRIGDRTLDPERPPYVVAEIGVNHNGDLELARRTIDAAVGAGADAVKFQTFRAEEFMADRELQYEYESQGQRTSESMYAMFKRLELPESWHTVLRDHARSRGVAFLSSAADPLSVQVLSRLDAPAIKVASEDLINLPLLECIGATALPVILSTGMADEEETDLAIETLREAGCRDLLLLHCVSLYPTPDDQVNLRRMITLRDRYGLPVGYSDHTVGPRAAALATALGSVFIEKHFTLDRGLPGPDHAMSADPAGLAELVDACRSASAMLGSAAIAPSTGEAATSRVQFRRSIVAARDIPAGAVIARDMLALKRPGNGIRPRELKTIIGRHAARAFRSDEQLAWEGLS